MSPISDRFPIPISWSVTEPPLVDSKLDASFDMFKPQETELDDKLNWPKGTISVLNQAFLRNFRRTNGWQIPEGETGKPFQMAARVFRRGVAYQDQQLQQTSGFYSIKFSDHLDWTVLLPNDHFCIIDSRAAAAFGIARQPNRLFIQVNELNKTLETVALLRQTAQANLSYACWTIVGGGILADIASFAAALDNKDFRLVPTTLLAMIDACVGGKTGVNFPPYGKNQVGLFAFPTEVFVSADWLTRLPPREFLAGLAEGWKHAVLRGDSNLASKVTQLDQNSKLLAQYLRRLIQVKADIIAKDPTEQHIRSSLNLGHTLAHAIERTSHKKRPEAAILHGEAVGIGLLFCIELSFRLGYLDDEKYQFMQKQLFESNFLISLKNLKKFLGAECLGSTETIQELLIGIEQDKKNKGDGASEWVLLKDWGQTVSIGNSHTVSVKNILFISIFENFIANWESVEAAKL